MIKIGLERLLNDSEFQVAGPETAKLRDPYRDSAEFSDHGVNTTVDVIDQSSLTLGCNCLLGITPCCDEGT